MAYDKSYNPSEYRNDGKASWWKRVKKPFLYTGTALALFVGGIFGYNALNKAAENRDAKEEPIVQKATQPVENNLKKAVSKLAQKETAANSSETAANVQENAASMLRRKKQNPKHGRLLIISSRLFRDWRVIRFSWIRPLRVNWLKTIKWPMLPWTIGSLRKFKR